MVRSRKLTLEMKMPDPKIAELEARCQMLKDKAVAHEKRARTLQGELDTLRRQLEEAPTKRVERADPTPTRAPRKKAFTKKA